MKVIRIFALLAIGSAYVGCGSSNAPSTAPVGLSLNGTFSGAANDNSGPGILTWVIIQSGNNVSGPLTFSNSPPTITGRGTANGTLNSTTLTFNLAVPAGGLPDPYGTCSIALSGTANNVTNTTITGTYSGNNSCSGAITNGSFTLTKH